MAQKRLRTGREAVILDRRQRKNAFARWRYCTLPFYIHEPQRRAFPTMGEKKNSLVKFRDGDQSCVEVKNGLDATAVVTLQSASPMSAAMGRPFAGGGKTAF